MVLKSELQQVPVEQRVPGKVYGVSDDLDGELSSVEIHENKDDGYSNPWDFWFALPESMLPTKEVLVMPEIGKEYEFSDDGEVWYRHKLKSFHTALNVYDKIRPIQTMPSLIIPQGTKSEQIKALELLLNELKK
jgi:hypothetical protein